MTSALAGANSAMAPTVAPRNAAGIAPGGAAAACTAAAANHADCRKLVALPAAMRDEHLTARCVQRRPLRRKHAQRVVEMVGVERRDYQRERRVR